MTLSRCALRAHAGKGDVERRIEIHGQSPRSSRSTAAEHGLDRCRDWLLVERRDRARSRSRVCDTFIICSSSETPLPSSSCRRRRCSIGLALVGARRRDMARLRSRPARPPLRRLPSGSAEIGLFQILARHSPACSALATFSASTVWRSREPRHALATAPRRAEFGRDPCRDDLGRLIRVNKAGKCRAPASVNRLKDNRGDNPRVAHG